MCISAGAVETEGDVGWPRQVNAGNSVITMHQPQVDKWTDYQQLELRAAIGVRPKSEAKDRMGVLTGTAQTVVDTSSRNVGLSQFKYTVRFPSVSADEAASLEADVRKAFPGTRTVSIALDRVLAYMDKERTTLQKQVPVSFDPPGIFYSSTPAILLMFMGEPKFSPVKKEDQSLLSALNTNWDLFLSTTDSKYYLLNDNSWLESTASGGWAQAKQLPAGLLDLPNDESWSETRKHVPGVAAASIPTVYQTTTPAELIITDGEPKVRPIEGTQIMQITNTPSLLFFSGSDQNYYFLVAGRWFRAKQLNGSWEPGSGDLPADFANIPAGDQVGEVRSSVKGTPEAQDAILLASVPTMASVTTDEATLEVVYDGEPVFEPIPNTAIQFATNTAQDVFLANGNYYCCSEGVWFCSSAPKGPWSLCKEVDPAIYTIPADHPKHNDTYVTVYDSGEDYVTYGYTSGYTGSYVSDDLLVFGAGIASAALLYNWFDDDDHHHHYNNIPVPYYSYGIAAHYDYASGSYYGAAHHYGPYGGAGRYAAYNPATGVYSRGAAAYGPYSNAGVRQAYNPWTDTYAARARVNTPAGSAGRFYAERDGESISGGSRSGPQGRAGWAQTSEGGKGVAWDTRNNEGAAAKNKEGDVMVGNDGNIYKREDGDWQKYDDGDWDNVNRPENARAEAQGERGANIGQTAVAAGAGAMAATAVNRGGNNTNPVASSNARIQSNLAGAGPSNLQANANRSAQPSTMDRSTYDNLQRDQQARARGNENTKQIQNRASSTPRPTTTQRQSASSSQASRPQSSSQASRPQSSSAGRSQPTRSQPSAAPRPSAGASRGGGGGGRR